MRISDWSSDVCSSDLELDLDHRRAPVPYDGRAHHRLVGPCPDERRVGRHPVRTEAREVVDRLDHVGLALRSEERRVGKEWVSTCRSSWSAYPSQKKQTK